MIRKDEILTALNSGNTVSSPEIEDEKLRDKQKLARE
jgi:hypothetical protein